MVVGGLRLLVDRGGGGISLYVEGSEGGGGD
jgi:hypothetical protein